jgi:hypothetical protein
VKKAFVAILALIYLGSSTGATLHMHYCQGKLVEAGLWHDKESKCGGCGMEKETATKKGCCKDEHKQIKLEKDQKSAEQPILFMAQSAIAITPIQYFSIQDHPVENITTSFPVSNAPPRWKEVTIYLANRNFRI